jgi:hypothetical protein
MHAGDFIKQSGFFAMRQLPLCKPEVGFAASEAVAIGPLRW